MSHLIPVVYVGHKPHAFDNVAHSGKSWQGKGDVQEVSDAQARLLLKYPDQWALVNAADQAVVDAPVVIEGRDEDGARVSIDPGALKKPLEKMNKAELFALARQSWGKELDRAMSRKVMIDQIEEWMNTLPLVEGA